MNRHPGVVVPGARTLVFWRERGIRWRRKIVWAALGCGTWTLPAAVTPTIFRSGPGQVEVAAIDATAAQSVVTSAEEAWARLAVPLRLPKEFSTAVFVRLVPVAEWQDTESFRVRAEPGGVVSVAIAWSDTVAGAMVRRALVRGLLLRLMVAQRGADKIIAPPRWLEHACLEWWRTRADAAQFDALKYESAKMTPAAMADLLTWKPDDAETRERVVGAGWLLAFLQSESTKADEWPALLRRLLGGEEPLAALAASFPGRFGDAAERELWWQTGWHHLRRVRTLPTLGSAESRAELERLQRFVFAVDEHDAVLPFREVLAQGRELFVRAELQRRAAELKRAIPLLHPFYRNAGISLAEVLASRATTEARRDEICRAFESDWRDASELEAAAAKALDALEKK